MFQPFFFVILRGSNLRKRKLGKKIKIWPPAYDPKTKETAHKSFLKVWYLSAMLSELMRHELRVKEWEKKSDKEKEMKRNSRCLQEETDDPEIAVFVEKKIDLSPFFK